MKILIAGGTGFVGQALVQHYLSTEKKCTVISRSKETIDKIFDGKVKAVTWEELQDEGMHEIKTADLIINVTGANVGEKRWTEKRKKELLDSRIIPTTTLAKLCAKLGKNSPPFFNTSGSGVYGPQTPPEEGLPPPLDETTPVNYANPPNFFAQIGCRTELATQPAKEAGTRVINMRFGAVLGKDGGVLAKLKWPFLLGVGGPLGSGKQPFPWIALEDLIRAIDFLFEHPEITGPVNFVAPKAVTQKEFANALGKALHRPSVVPMPASILKMIFGQMAEEFFLAGQHLTPRVLLEHGFQFKYPDIQQTLKSIF